MIGWMEADPIDVDDGVLCGKRIERGKRGERSKKLSTSQRHGPTGSMGIIIFQHRH